MQKDLKNSPLSPPSFVWTKGNVKEGKMNEWIIPIQEAVEIEPEEEWDVVMFGIPLSRSSISVSGASEFPDAFRRGWKGFSTYNLDEEVDLEELTVLDAGNVDMHFTDISLSHSNIVQSMENLTDKFPQSMITAIGGDHSITAMVVKGIKNAKKNETIGILQLDTHFDLRDLKDHGPTNGTPIRNLIESGTIEGTNVHNIGLHGFFNGKSLVESAKVYGVNYTTLSKARDQGVVNAVKRALETLGENVDHIHLTVDMDVLDIAYAPGVPASTPGGMTTHELFQAVFAAGLHEKVKSMDIVCLDPTKDHPAQPTVKAGIHVFLSFLSGFAKRKI
ncbi:agmatinase family protein [Falsibacillus pallidus]|uniref:Formiminoglutamase n=1 Tax=Falsibacillus pallidus TaxID=493781 RepID=A0A370GQI6_9BACI|nr:agmatinase family protein [Falsibacillus pallidus]RDI45985.1 formiminoglutamase [Falsibacillus pallidus]